MDERVRHEGDLFVRYEARIVAAEIAIEDFREWRKKTDPVLVELRDNDLMAATIAENVNARTRVRLSKVMVAIALAALVVPAIVGPIVTVLLVKGHL